MPFILDGMASLCCAASLEKQRFSAFALLTLLSWSTSIVSSEQARAIRIKIFVNNVHFVLIPSSLQFMMALIPLDYQQVRFLTIITNGNIIKQYKLIAFISYFSQQVFLILATVKNNIAKKQCSFFHTFVCIYIRGEFLRNIRLRKGERKGCALCRQKSFHNGRHIGLIVLERVGQQC